MSIRYSKHYLNKLEDLMSESEFILRYEKGNFKSGYCLLRDTNIAVVNKYISLEGKINCLIDIIKSIDIDAGSLSDKNQKLLGELHQMELNL